MKRKLVNFYISMSLYQFKTSVQKKKREKQTLN